MKTIVAYIRYYYNNFLNFIFKILNKNKLMELVKNENISVCFCNRNFLMIEIEYIVYKVFFENDRELSYLIKNALGIDVSISNYFSMFRKEQKKDSEISVTENFNDFIERKFSFSKESVDDFVSL